MGLKVGRYLIYGLIDPRNQCLCYLGKTHKRREWRLVEHIELARNGDERPVYNWIRELQKLGLKPEIFVWKRIASNENWREAEKEAIFFWRNKCPELPYFHPPQTPKSKKIIIQNVNLLNATNGG